MTSSKILTPDEIRATRERLGLSQREAGRLLGGGPRAFAKYEAGTVNPSAASNNLLLVLRSNPSSASVLFGPQYRPVEPSRFPLFEVTGKDISELSIEMLPKLLRRLLSVEAEFNDLPREGIHVASNIFVPDDGEDGRIVWSGGPKRTRFLPSRYCQFQLKAGKVYPGKLRNEVLTKERLAKDLVAEMLRSGGNYILLCSNPYTQNKIQLRIEAMHAALIDAGLNIEVEKVDFRDADQIAEWVNFYPSVATWVREKVRPVGLGPFRSWAHWAGKTEHSRIRLVGDERLADLRVPLLKKVKIPRKVVRIVGLSGIGKSRLCLEAFGTIESDEATGLLLSAIVLYADLDENNPGIICRTLQDLAASGVRAIVVIDRCYPEVRQSLSNIAIREDSSLSLVTLEDALPSETLDKDTLPVSKASDSVVEGILDQMLPSHPLTDRLRLARFAQGFPEIAIGISATWEEGLPLVKFTDEELVESYILERSKRSHSQLLDSAKLLATFGLIDTGKLGDLTLKKIANLSGTIDPDRFCTEVADMVRRGIVQRRGRLVALQPLPAAMSLANLQWSEWEQQPGKWDKAFSGGISPSLSVSAARQLALLNTTAIAREVAGNICREGGPFEVTWEDTKLWRAEVISFLAEVNPLAVANLIQRLIERPKTESEPFPLVSSHFVPALQKITFHRATFEIGASLLLKCARLDGNASRSDASRIFTELFHIPLGGTEAVGTKRIDFLAEINPFENQEISLLAIEALSSGLEFNGYQQVSSAQMQGSAPTLRSWCPTTREEEQTYMKGCMELLLKFAPRNDIMGTTARHRLGAALDSLILRGFIDLAEILVQQVAPMKKGWPYGLRTLNGVLLFHSEDLEAKDLSRVQDLAEQLQPRDLQDRVKILVTEVPMPDAVQGGTDGLQVYETRLAIVEDLAKELLREQTILSRVLPDLCRGTQSMADDLGKAVAEAADLPLDWFDIVQEAAMGVPSDSFNPDFLVGFLHGLRKSHPETVDDFKQKMAGTSRLAPALLRICLRLGIVESDFQLVIGAFQEGMLPPWQLERWAMRGVLSEIPISSIASFLDSLIGHSPEAFIVAIHLTSVLASDKPEKLSELLPQVCRLAENFRQWRKAQFHDQQSPVMSQFRFCKIMDEMLNRGRQNPDACVTVLALGKALCQVEESRDCFLIKDVLPKMLSDFPEIVWSLIGQAIASDSRRARVFEFILGDSYVIGRDSNPIFLNLPENTIFAWCHAHPTCAPAFTAAVLPVLASKPDDSAVHALHPLLSRLLDDFGEQEDVRNAVESNMLRRGWFKSETTKYTPYEEPLSSLHKHHKQEVRTWAKTLSRDLEVAIAKARVRDEDRDAISEFHGGRFQFSTEYIQ